VASAAELWAAEKLKRQPAGEVLGSAMLGALVNSAFGGGWLGMSIAERRAAKKIRRLSDLNSDEE
jgi:hypothetical protein